MHHDTILPVPDELLHLIEKRENEERRKIAERRDSVPELTKGSCHTSPVPCSPCTGDCQSDDRRSGTDRRETERRAEDRSDNPPQ